MGDPYVMKHDQQVRERNSETDTREVLFSLNRLLSTLDTELALAPDFLQGDKEWLSEEVRKIEFVTELRERVWSFGMKQFGWQD